MVPLYHGGKK
ncbi:hypothetical protein E2C01_091188 [Portunus trituberculatus]|uniref:Uncharacterized protein n=1 Tax=Portunus trituberculatus TaxID=210409 RepID=A0A5B7JSC0_PORTR|nr:hypothetical protein [Portunus trituberculatus]